MSKIKLQFEGGESRRGDEPVNYLIGIDENTHNILRDDDGDLLLYAECTVPVDEEVSDDYGYVALKDDILEQAKNLGISESDLSFHYDGSEEYLEDDAYADVDVRH